MLLCQRSLREYQDNELVISVRRIIGLSGLEERISGYNPSDSLRISILKDTLGCNRTTRQNRIEILHDFKCASNGIYSRVWPIFPYQYLLRGLLKKDTKSAIGVVHAIHCNNKVTISKERRDERRGGILPIDANSLINMTPPDTSLSESPVVESVEGCILDRVTTGCRVKVSIYGPYK